jgi:hypothetical protein
MPITIIDPKLHAEWDPHTPASDTLLRRFLMNWVPSLESETRLSGGRSIRQDDLAAVDQGRGDGLPNVVTLLAPLFESGVEEVMQELDAFFGFNGTARTGSVHMFSPWPTPDLRPHGWTLTDYLPLMYRPAGGEVPVPPPGLRVEKVHDERSLRGFEHAMVRGFPLEGAEKRPPGEVFVNDLLADDRNHMWVGWEGDRPVCAASTYVAEGINNVTLVATIPEARRRGYGSIVTWHATLADPTLPSMLGATQDGRPVYEKMGYVALIKFTLWTRDRPSPT